MGRKSPRDSATSVGEFGADADRHEPHDHAPERDHDPRTDAASLDLSSFNGVLAFCRGADEPLPAIHCAVVNFHVKVEFC